MYDIYRGIIIHHLKVNFIGGFLNYLIVSSVSQCDVLYRCDTSSAHIQGAAVLYCVDICSWIISSDLLLLGWCYNLCNRHIGVYVGVKKNVFECSDLYRLCKLLVRCVKLCLCFRHVSFVQFFIVDGPSV